MDFWSLRPLMPYEQARKLQLQLVELRANDQIPDTVLFLEHEPVVTRGQGLQFSRSDVDKGARLKHVPLAAPLPAGVAFAESERGGDLTYHGPGQLVIYPIFKLDGRGFSPHHDISSFMRRFEQAVISVVQDLCEGRVEGSSREGATGVWVRERGAAEDSTRKVASLGIAVRRWVTYHGLALNCVNGLDAFRMISPCGFSPEVMTRLLDWLVPGSELAVTLADWKGRGRDLLERKIADRLSGQGSHILKVEELSELPALAKATTDESDPNDATSRPVGQPGSVDLL